MTVAITVFVSGKRALPGVVRDIQNVTTVATRFGDVSILELNVESDEATPRLEIGGITYVRLLDRFYLPEDHDAATTDAFFTRIADDYDVLVDAERNIQNLANLIKFAVTDITHTTDPKAILDFGCGTGLSVVALDRLGTSLVTKVTLVGFDRCARMREVARQRGLNVLAQSVCEDLADAGPFNAAIASYVFHFGVADCCLKALHAALVTGGRLALNFHKATGDDLHILDSRAEAAGFRLSMRYDDREHGSISIYCT